MVKLIAREIFEKLPRGKQLEYLRGVKAIRGREDLIYLAREILGYKDILDHVHGRFVRLIKSLKRRKMGLMPRNSYKTSLGTISNTVQKILNNPDIRILITSEVLDNSEKFLGQIKRHLRQENFREIYGDLISVKHKETSREFTVNTRVDNTLKEPTVYAAGIGTINVGMHFDLIIIDDPHSEKNVGTKEQIEKVIAHYRLLLPMLEPGGELIIWGTRWHFLDLYDFLLEEEIPGNDSWEVLEVDAEERRADGKLFFEERLSPEFLAEQRKALGEYLYSCQFRNRPVSEATQVFKRSFFRYWSKDDGDLYPVQDGKRVLLNVYILIDRAFSSSVSADYTGCICVGISSGGNIYVLEAARKKCGLQELFDLIVGWRKKYGTERVRKVGIETINWEEAEIFFKQAMGKINDYFMLERLVPDSKRSKESRIEMALQARYANGAVYHRKRMVELEDELLRFPKAPHDDLLDALAYIVQLMLVPGDPKLETDRIEYRPSGWFGKSGY